MNGFNDRIVRGIMGEPEEEEVRPLQSPLQSALQNDGQEEYEESLYGIKELNALYENAAKRIREQRVGPSGGEYWYNLAAALGAPTKTGSRGETMANVAQALGRYRSAQREAEAQKQQQIEQLMFTKQAELLKRKYAVQDALRESLIKREGSNRPIILGPGQKAYDPTTRKLLAEGPPKTQYALRRLADGSYGLIPMVPEMNEPAQGVDSEQDPDTLPPDFFDEE